MERVTITFRFEGGDKDKEIARLRRLLKFALRTCRMRCVRITEERAAPNTKATR